MEIESEHKHATHGIDIGKVHASSSQENVNHTPHEKSTPHKPTTPHNTTTINSPHTNITHTVPNTHTTITSQNTSTALNSPHSTTTTSVSHNAPSSTTINSPHKINSPHTNVNTNANMSNTPNTSHSTTSHAETSTHSNLPTKPQEPPVPSYPYEGNPVMSSVQARQYIQSSLGSVLPKALAELCKAKPAQPISFLANFLLENNPNKPKVILPLECEPVIDSNSGVSVESLQLLQRVELILVLGIPGCGKRTQCEYVVAEWERERNGAGNAVTAIYVNDLVNDWVAQNKRTGQNNGITSTITNNLLFKAIIDAVENISTPNVTVLVHGFPETLDQVVLLEEGIRSPKFAIFVECTESEARKRLVQKASTLSHTEHKNLDEVAYIDHVDKRFGAFYTYTSQVVQHYESMGKILRVKGEGKPERVYQQINKQQD
eukprot:TRINITY_DN2298_c0_g1_i1.p1 TRINITY_DN2298_c0_g1~~TRINITY_DN2298_c0_g1_i1.p1  ORF type:complete len:432 (+),score=110.92 TRINITY_DN2298_c0_g1_i1:128-1423(+)